MHGQMKRKRCYNDSMPSRLYALSIREPSSPTIESSLEEEDEPRHLPSSFLFLAQCSITGILQGESPEPPQRATSRSSPSRTKERTRPRVQQSEKDPSP